jgi:hypothetical protein
MDVANRIYVTAITLISLSATSSFALRCDPSTLTKYQSASTCPDPNDTSVVFIHIEELLTEYYKFSCTDECGQPAELTLAMELNCHDHRPTGRVEIDDLSDKVDSQLAACPAEKVRVSKVYGTDPTPEERATAASEAFDPVLREGRRLQQN